MIQQNIKAATAVGSCLSIGQDRCGRWVVKDTRSVCGGLFADRTAAIRSRCTNANAAPQSVIMLPDGLELDATFSLPITANYSSKRAA
jgi:hypothetical protein